MSGAVKVGTETVLFSAGVEGLPLDHDVDLRAPRHQADVEQVLRRVAAEQDGDELLGGLLRGDEAGHRLARILGAHRARHVHRQDDVERLHLARHLGRGADGHGLISEQPHEGDGNGGGGRDRDLLIDIVGDDFRPVDAGAEIAVGKVGVEDHLDVVVARRGEEAVAAGERRRVDRGGEPRLGDVAARRIDPDADATDQRHGRQRNEHGDARRACRRRIYDLQPRVSAAAGNDNRDGAPALMHQRSSSDQFI